MGATTSGRARARALGRTGRCAPGLFAPLILAQAAEVEALDLHTFLADPTKLSRGLTALAAALPVDALTVTAHDALLAEAAGATLDWSHYPPTVTAPPPGLLSPTLADTAPTHPRVAAAAEATACLAATAPGEPALVAALTGPATLAAQLTAAPPDETVYETAGAITLAVAKRLLEAGTNILLLIEDTAPADDATDAWRDALSPVANVARFHQAVPVMLLGDGTAVPPTMGVCTPPGAPPPTGPPVRVKGLALPADPKEWAAAPPTCPLVTTAGPVPGDIPFAAVLDACRAR